MENNTAVWFVSSIIHTPRLCGCQFSWGRKRRKKLKKMSVQAIKLNLPPLRSQEIKGSVCFLFAGAMRTITRPPRRRIRRYKGRICTPEAVSYAHAHTHADTHKHNHILFAFSPFFLFYFSQTTFDQKCHVCLFIYWYVIMMMYVSFCFV